MEAKELMIGDWVNSYDAQAYKVTSIHINDKGCAVRLEFDEYIVETWADKIEPISLTEGILKANGFMFDSVEQEYLLEGFPSVLVDYYSVCMYWQGHLLRFYYVHQLQHALRLCGLNDIADNFKVTE